MPSESAVQNQFDAAHFAFLRAIVQGMDWQQSWNRYVRRGDRPADQQTLAQTIAAIRNTLKAAARRNNRPGAARLVLAHLRRPQPAAGAFPALADFVFAENLDGFSETEQLAAYAAQFPGPDDPQRRLDRLVVRQLEALHWLQHHANQVPSTADALADWLSRFQAARLASAGVDTVGQLATRLERYGDRWACGISGLGAAKAGAIETWYRDRARQMTTARSTDAAHRADAPPLLPLVHTAAFAALAPQRTVSHRPPADCLIAATSDCEALRIWLHDKGAGRPEAAGRVPEDAPAGGSGRTGTGEVPIPGWAILLSLSSTQRAYWKEAERFQLWLMHERQSTLSTATAADCAAYAVFLERPAPHWCGPRGHAKHDPRWRPFAGPLSPSARRYACSVLQGLYRYLVQKRYLHSNPWDADVAPAAGARDGDDGGRAGQALSAAARQRLAIELAGLPVSSANLRLRVAVQLLQSAGISLRAAAAACVDDLQRPPGAQRWRLQVRRRGGVTRSVALPAQLIESLSAYFLHRGLEAPLDSPRNQGAALLGRAADALQRAPWTPCAQLPFDPAAGIAPGTLRDQLRLFFQSCARASTEKPELAAEFRRATCRSLHTPRRRRLQSPT